MKLVNEDINSDNKTSDNEKNYSVWTIEYYQK
jgi:hypothetical protein